MENTCNITNTLSAALPKHDGGTRSEDLRVIGKAETNETLLSGVEHPFHGILKRSLGG
jgi:hypothetical protein